MLKSVLCHTDAVVEQIETNGVVAAMDTQEIVIA
jgi:hypothetical protein